MSSKPAYVWVSGESLSCQWWRYTAVPFWRESGTVYKCNDLVAYLFPIALHCRTATRPHVVTESSSRHSRRMVLITSRRASIISVDDEQVDSGLHISSRSICRIVKWKYVSFWIDSVSYRNCGEDIKLEWSVRRATSKVAKSSQVNSLAN